MMLASLAGIMTVRTVSRLIHRVIGQNFHGRKQTIYTRRDPSPGDSRLEFYNCYIDKHKHNILRRYLLASYLILIESAY